MTLLEWLVPVVSVLGAASSGIFALASLLLTRRMQRAEIHREISGLYDRLMEVRLDHPEMLELGHSWTPGNLERVYRQGSAEDREWARYYTYVELCLGFCNAVLYARSKRLLTRDAFAGQYEPLVKLLLTEHYPILRDLLEAGGEYLSVNLKRLWHEAREAGWDWASQHAALLETGRRKAG
jgi:hypothetical protein